jgi:hypothetical protein
MWRGESAEGMLESEERMSVWERVGERAGRTVGTEVGDEAVAHCGRVGSIGTATDCTEPRKGRSTVVPGVKCGLQRVSTSIWER